MKNINNIWKCKESYSLSKKKDVKEGGGGGKEKHYNP